MELLPNVRREYVLDIYGVTGIKLGNEKKEGNNSGDAQSLALKSSLKRRLKQCLNYVRRK